MERQCCREGCHENQAARGKSQGMFRKTLVGNGFSNGECS
jgi:hypothetical protein